MNCFSSYRRQYKPIPIMNWKYQCRANQCIQLNPNQVSEQETVFEYLEGCKSICGPYGAL